MAWALGTPAEVALRLGDENSAVASRVPHCAFGSQNLPHESVSDSWCSGARWTGKPRPRAQQTRAGPKSDGSALPAHASVEAWRHPHNACTGSPAASGQTCKGEDRPESWTTSETQVACTTCASWVWARAGHASLSPEGHATPTARLGTKPSRARLGV